MPRPKKTPEGKTVVNHDPNQNVTEDKQLFDIPQKTEGEKHSIDVESLLAQDVELTPERIKQFQEDQKQDLDLLKRQDAALV